MSRRARNLTPEDKRRAWDIYAQVGSWAKVAKRFDIGVTTLREKIGVTPQTRYSSRRQTPVMARSFDTKRRETALYDPHRDKPPVYDNETNAMILGDPPRGRRELLEANAERTSPPDAHPNSKYWHL